DRISDRADRERTEIDEHDIGLRARGETSEVFASERACAAEVGGGEHIESAGGLVVLLYDLADRRGGPHLGKHVKRVGVGSERHVDAGIEIALEALECTAAPREGERRVRDARLRARD